MEKKVIIIGAGPAGLTAAYKLLEHGNILPIVIEKEDFVGGISRTVVHNGNRIDIGGHRFFSKSKEVNDIWNEVMPTQGKPTKYESKLKDTRKYFDNGPNPDEVDKVFLIRSRVSRILYMRKFFDYPISMKVSTIVNMGFLNTFNSAISYAKAQLFKRKEVTLEDFMVNRFGKSLYQMFFKDYTYKVWGRYPCDISADWGAQRIKGLSLTKAILHMLKSKFKLTEKSESSIETSLIEEFLYPKMGPGQFWENMADKIVESGGEILKKTRVVGINIYEDTINSVNIIENGIEKRIEGECFISTMPINELIGAINVNIPVEVQNIASSLPFRDFITVGLLVPELKIKNTTTLETINGRVPDCWIYVQEPDVKVGRIQVFNNWSPYLVKDFENTMWIGLEYFCSEGDDLWNLSDKEFINYAIDEAVRIGVIDQNDVLDSVRIKVPKAYPAYFGSYDNFNIVRQYIDNFSNLYCIGRNGQHRYNNMDHSMLTAIEATRLIIKGIESKDTLWSINTEKNYHEEVRNGIDDEERS